MQQQIQKAKFGAARLSITSNTILTLGKLAAGLYMGSVSVISEAVHSSLDLLAAIIAYLAVRQSARPADQEHRYGHGKFENLASITEALLIFAAAVLIVYHSIPRLLHRQFVVQALDWGMLVMGLSAAVNWFISSHLLRVARLSDSPALQADALHLRTDVYTSLGVLAGIGGIRLTGWYWLDPAIAMVVALMIIRAAWELTADSLRSMLDQSLPAGEEELICQVLQKHSASYVAYQNLRTRKAGPYRYIDLQLVVPARLTTAQAHAICDAIEQDLQDQLQNPDVIIHVEPCTADCQQCPVCPGRPEGKA